MRAYADVHRGMATTIHTAPTIRPASYPELEREVYRAADFVTERETEIPPPSTQRDLRSQASRGRRAA